MNIMPINYAHFDSTSFGNKLKISSANNLMKKILIPTIGLLSMQTIANAENIKTRDKDTFIKTETVQLTKDFKINNKDYTLFYTDGGFSTSEDDNVVADIYFVPKNKKDPALKLEQLSLYKSDKADRDFIIITVSEQYKEKTSCPKPPQEVKLSYEEGKYLLDLYLGITEFYLLPGSNTYNEK